MDKSIRVLRQVTNAHMLLGNPIADNKFNMNNQINNVGLGDKGYIPNSYVYHHSTKSEKEMYQRKYSF